MPFDLVKEYHEKLWALQDRESVWDRLRSFFTSYTKPSALLYHPFAKEVFHPQYSSPAFKDFTPAERYAMRIATMPYTESLWQDEAWDECQHYWGYVCAYCGADDDLVRDHIVPVSSVHCPGTIPSNLLPLCSDCNREKSNHDLARFVYLNNSRLICSTGIPKQEADRVAMFDAAGLTRRVWLWQDKSWSRWGN